MSTATQPIAGELALPLNADALDVIERVSGEYSIQALETAGHFTRALKMAVAIQSLEKLISQAAMRTIMGLQNSTLGFLTDKPGGYDEATVKRCAIECLLRGGYLTNNEMNIISGKCYMAKNYFMRKVSEFNGLTNLRWTPGVPNMHNGGALVPFIAQWHLNGSPQRLERTLKKGADGMPVDERIPVKVNSGMGADAIIGKATRKGFAAVYGQLTGSISTPDGDVDDVTFVHDQQPTAAPTNRLDALTQRLSATPPTNGNGHHEPEAIDEPAGESADTSDPPAPAEPSQDAPAWTHALVAEQFGKCKTVQDAEDTGKIIAAEAPAMREHVVEVYRQTLAAIEERARKAGKTKQQEIA